MDKETLVLLRDGLRHEGVCRGTRPLDGIAKG